MKNKLFLKLFITLALVITSALSCAYAFSFRNMTLDFIQMSDTHITLSRGDTPYKALSSSLNLLKDGIEQINSIKGLDFVLFTGDLVDSATEENFEGYYQALKKLKYPHLNAFGNHDFYGMEKEEVLEIVRKNNPNYTFEDSYYAFSPKTDYRIIILDSTIKGQNTANGELGSEQLAFLDNELSQNQDKIILIAMHHPSVEPFVSHDHTLLDAKEFNEILLKYKNPIVVVSGHYHASKLRRMGNIIFVSTPAMVTYPMAFRHIKITNFKDRVKYEFGFVETRLSETKEQNRQGVISYSTLEGGLNDKDYTFTYFKKHPKSAASKRRMIEHALKEKPTSKKQAKKLLEPKARKIKTPKEKKVKEKALKQKPIKEKTVKEKQIKQKKEKIIKQKPIKVQKEKPVKIKKEKVKKEKAPKIKKEKAPKEKIQKESFFQKMKNKFKNMLNIFKRKPKSVKEEI